MDQQTCVITGGTSGIGKATALGLAKAGAKLVLVGRDPARGAQAVADIVQQSGNSEVEFAAVDLSEQPAVRQLAATLLSRHPAIHVLINDAGIVCPRRELTADGIERTLAVNHLAPFLLTNLLLETLKASAPARVINVSSQVHAHDMDFDNLQGEQTYAGLDVYRRSKLANILFTFALARRLEGTGVTVNCLHPGVVQTPLLAAFGEAETVARPPTTEPARQPNKVALAVKYVVDRIKWRLFPSGLDTPEQAAATSIYLATSQEVAGVSGRYFVKCKEAVPAQIAHDEEVAERLWAESGRLVGL